MKHILSRIDELAKDQYGNYVIQHILEHGLPDQKSIIIQKIIDNLATMASHKFARYVKNIYIYIYIAMLLRNVLFMEVRTKGTIYLIK